MRVATVLSLLVLTGCASAPRYPHLTPGYDLMVEGMVVGVETVDGRPHPAGPGGEWDEFLWGTERFLLVVEHVDGDKLDMNLVRGDTLNLFCVASPTGFKAGEDGEEDLVMMTSWPSFKPCPEAGQSGLFGFYRRRDELVLDFFGDPQTQQAIEYRLKEEEALGELGSIPEDFP